MSKQRPKQKRREGRAVGATEGREESSMRLVEDAVNLKDQQIALIRRENQKLMGWSLLTDTETGKRTGRQGGRQGGMEDER